MHADILVQQHLLAQEILFQPVYSSQYTHSVAGKGKDAFSMLLRGKITLQRRVRELLQLRDAAKERRQQAGGPTSSIVMSGTGEIVCLCALFRFQQCRICCTGSDSWHFSQMANLIKLKELMLVSACCLQAPAHSPAPLLQWQA